MFVSPHPLRTESFSPERRDQADHEDRALRLHHGDPSGAPDPVVNPESDTPTLPLSTSSREGLRWALQLQQARVIPQTQPQGAESERRGQLRVLVL